MGNKYLNENRSSNYNSDQEFVLSTYDSNTPLTSRVFSTYEVGNIYYIVQLLFLWFPERQQHTKTP
uniref:Uncharacterized protein n=1 Tax=Arundo donax TaxID=35708 RepID=A0A0A9GEF3_ARUDO